MSNGNAILTYFSCFLYCLWWCFINTEGVDMRNTCVKSACVGDTYIVNWVLLDYRKKTACLYTSALVIIVITLTCILYIA